MLIRGIKTGALFIHNVDQNDNIMHFVDLCEKVIIKKFRKFIKSDENCMNFRADINHEFAT